jgi:hypothetical protein
MEQQSADRVRLAEGMVAAGLVTAGLVLGGGPMMALAAGAVGGVGGNLVANLAQAGFDDWRARWLSEHAALGEELRSLVAQSFASAVAALERDWRRHDGVALRHRDRHAYERSRQMLRWLRDDALALFTTPDRLRSLAAQDEVRRLAMRDEAELRRFLDEKLAGYLFGHDEDFIRFVVGRLPDIWMLELHGLLVGQSEVGVRAFRTIELLWRESLTAGLQRLPSDAAETRAAVMWLKDWAQRSEEHRLSASIIEDALESAIGPMRQELRQVVESSGRVERAMRQFEPSPGGTTPTAPVHRPNVIGGPLLAFISSVIGELQEERRSVAAAIDSLGVTTAWVFEREGASSQPIPDAYLRYVRAADLFILLVKSSVTDPVIAEYELALELGKPILAFFIDAPAQDERVRDLRQRLIASGSHKYAVVPEGASLVDAVLASLGQEIVGSFRDRLEEADVDDVRQRVEHRDAVRSAPFLVPSLPPQGVIGRDSELRRVVELLSLDDAVDDVAPVALRGMGGIGKTTLALALARLPSVRRYFADGILWTALGPSPVVRTALDAWGRALGIDLLTERDEMGCSLRLREALTNRRTLLILDDVWNAQDGRPFAVAGSRGRTLLTTREVPVAHAFATRDRTIRVDLLQPTDALQLLHRLAPEAVLVDEAVALRLCERLEFLPLGLTLAGRLLANEADVPNRMQRLLGELIERREARLSLIEEEGRIGLGSEPVSVQAILGMSVDRLEQTNQDRFAMLSVFGGEPLTWEVHAAAHIWDCSVDDAESTISVLIQRGLVERRNGRYWMHALLADYAAELLVVRGL